MEKTGMPLGYSYIRWSHPSQGDGDSHRRQTDGRAEDWCRRNKVQFDPSLVLVDKGRSAHKRDDWDSYALAEFIRAVHAGRVEPGSFLIVENLDRISRERPITATNRFTGILEAGISIVQLSPEQVFTPDSDFADLMRAILEFGRGHSESVQKVNRVGGAWAAKRDKAATTLMTRKVPGWLEVVEAGKGEFKAVLREDRKAVIARIFRMTTDGFGVQAIAQKLNRDGVPSWRQVQKANRTDEPARWNETAVYFVLKSPATFGQFQPCRGKERVPVGDPIPGYFPAAITEAQFHAAHRALQTRRSKNFGGKRGRHVNLFSGLMVDARDGGALTIKHTLQQFRHPQVIPVRAKQGAGSRWSSFPADILEDAVMSKLEEIEPADVLPVTYEGQKVADLSKQHEEAAELVKKYKARMEADPVSFDLFADEATKAEARRKKMAGELAEAQREAASPLSEAWGQFQGVGELLKADTSDDMRVKVRTAIRRVVKRLHCLFLGGQKFQTKKRYAVVQAEFVGSTAVRLFIVAYWPKLVGPGGKGQPERWGVISGRNEDYGRGGLLTPEGTEEVEGVFTALLQAEGMGTHTLIC
jgi:DNA invertase Pin-like site-specific DNA recombinase